MKQSLQLKLGHSLTMTPQLQQAIRLLQLSNVELQTEVQTVLESNMMLELDEEQQELAAPAADDTVATEGEEDDAETDIAAEADIPDDLPVDSAWEDIYDGFTVRSMPAFDGGVHEQQQVQDKTLRDHLLWQLNLMPAGETDCAIAVAIIDALDEDGYLTCSLEELRDSLGGDPPVDPGEMQAVLHLVQSMEPAGVAARDLQECMALQLGQLDPDTPWLREARELIGSHLQLLAAHDFSQIMRRMKLGREELQQVVALIQSLNPRPGGQVEEHHIQYIIPDVYVRKAGNVWKVELNTETVPHLRINSSYAGMIRRADSSADNVSLKTHLQEARWFIKSLQSRSETLLRVATCIVERQRAFLEHGEEAMKPLVLHDVAGELGMHESTISRVTTRKYMHTPRGIFELKYFFSSHVATEIGGTCSSTAIRAHIRKLVAAETPDRPLSDSRIAELLAERGIRVARRTVAKYRESLAIPPSNERKRLG
jgi:RNA polymerase sigma-54 factor